MVGLGILVYLYGYGFNCCIPIYIYPYNSNKKYIQQNIFIINDYSYFIFESSGNIFFIKLFISNGKC